MAVYQRGGSWVVSLGSGKDRYRATFKTEQEAETAELAEKLRRKTASAAQVAPADASKPRVEKTLKEAYDRTYRLHWKGEKAEKTHIVNAGCVMRALGPATLVSDITAEDITEMILEFEDQGNSGATINKKLSNLSMILKTAKQQWPGCLTELPAMVRRKESGHRMRWLDVPEEVQALEACEHLGLLDLKDYIIVAIDTGFRRGELLGFEVKDYVNGLLVLHDGETKSGKGRAIPATKRVHQIIERRSNYKHLFEGMKVHTLRWQWERLREFMGLTDDPQFVVHTLRHTCASRMVQRGVSLKIVQEWMGHASITTTLRYAKLAPTSLMMAKTALEEEPQVMVTPAPVALEPELQDF